MPKKKLQSLSQVNAKTDLAKPTCLDEVWGFDSMARYGTLSEEEYQASLQNMTRADLENHARSLNCMILESSERMRDTLMKHFRMYIASLNVPEQPKNRHPKITPEVQKILNEGR